MQLSLSRIAILATVAMLAALAAVAVPLWRAETAAMPNAAALTAGHAGSGTQVLGSVAPFTLVDDRGRPVTREDFVGRTWVAGFIFTRCAGPCLRIVGQIKLLDERLPPDVRLVCFTADPDYDTPEVLHRYRTQLKIPSKRWLLVTGEREAMYRLIRGSFHLGVEPVSPEESRPGQQVTHSTRLVVVDGKGQIRGYFDGEDPEEVDSLAAVVRKLTEEAS